MYAGGVIIVRSKRVYQTGIQDFVYEIIRSIEYIPNKDYITFREILSEVTKHRPDLRNPSAQVRQALYQLSHDRKYRKKRIEKVTAPTIKGVGWRIVK